MDSPALTPPRMNLGRSLSAEPAGSLPPGQTPLRQTGISHVGNGWLFEGQARVQGSVHVAGQVQGGLEASAKPGQTGSGEVRIEEGGSVEGRVRAASLVVRGRIEGEVDAAGGRVALYETAVVNGHVRYTHLQVNGAELNGRLERVKPGGDSGQHGA